MSRPYEPVTLSASSSDELARSARALAAFLADRADLPLAEVVSSLARDLPPLPHRLALVARDCADAAQRLRDPDHGDVHTGHVTRHGRPVAFLFPGVGDHYVQMAAGLYRHEPMFRAELDRCAELLRGHLGRDLREVLYPDDAQTPPDCPGGTDLRRLIARDGRSTELDRTAVAQPLVFAVEYALARLLVGFGVRPAALCGHSLGEYVAACLAGVLSPEDALALVARRAKLIDTAPEGAMIVVLLGADELAGRLDGELSLAATDSRRLSVASGPVPAVERLERGLAADGVASRRLPTRHAFHSSMLEPFERPLRELVAAARLRPPATPLLSNVSGTWLSDAQATDPQYWSQQMSHTVRFSDELAELWRLPAPILLEVGPGRTLGTLALQHPARRPDGTVLGTLPGAAASRLDVLTVLTTVARLWVEGVNVDWSTVLSETAAPRRNA